MIRYDPETNCFSSNATVFGELPQVMWHITSKCNMDCRFCFNDKDVRNEELYLTLDFRAITLKLKELGVQKVDISGGEPLLFDKLPDLVKACADNGLYVTITTNGSGAAHTSGWLLENWKMFSRIIVSIDGLEHEHTYLRSNTVAFSNAIGFCKRLKDMGCSRFRLNTVVTKCIISGAYYREFCAEIRRIEPNEWCLIQPHPSCQKSTFKAVEITAEEFDNFSANCIKEMSGSGVKLLFRPIRVYSTYWTLSANGILTYGDESNAVRLSLLDDGVEEIKNVISQYKQLLPEDAIL